MRFLCFILLYFQAYVWGADATLDIIKNIERLPKVEVRYINSAQEPYLSKIYNMLLSDLKISNHAEVVGVGAQDESIDYGSMGAQGVKLLVSLRVDKLGQINVRLYDVAHKSVLGIKDYIFTKKELYPFIAHRVAIDINDALKAPSIAWMARFVVFAKYIQPGVTNIVVADYSLTYQQDIIKNGMLNVFPKWANADQSAIYYTQYLRHPTIIKYNLRNGYSEVITQSDGMAAVSSVSQDGRKLLMTLAPEGQSDIFLYDTIKKSQTRLTHYQGIDVLGNFVDHEKAMVFVSDRAGYPNVYLKKLKPDAPIEQVVFYSKNNDSVTASGDNIVYVSREDRDADGQNVFNLHLITLKSDYVRRLTANGVNQMPRFSQDGKAIMFLKRASQQSALGVILLDYNQSYLFPLENTRIQSFDW
ncbi:Tol-Pal system protein TolB [Helicobacter baculiformis]|uniref:Tol-Pal system protein TolB n=1 Tax=Helicobacter baculiformis TaxID=427351 RepID=A0ABV7ZG57_9HELI|nr:Tol-Pal system protein TolB [Helicobacter baculiformis]